MPATRWRLEPLMPTKIFHPDLAKKLHGVGEKSKWWWWWWWRWRRQAPGIFPLRAPIMAHYH
uniref:Uncharacterized protein n=1 Tax=Oryza rufipogon TaxID=4529 RepID=A0A0E0R2J0_ORYRU